jgi:hypothetical protein
MSEDESPFLLALQACVVATASEAAVAWVVTGRWPKPGVLFDVAFPRPGMNGLPPFH